MKKIWKIILGIGGAIGAIILFILGRNSFSKQTFKEDLKKNKEKIQ